MARPRGLKTRDSNSPMILFKSKLPHHCHTIRDFSVVMLFFSSLFWFRYFSQISGSKCVARVPSTSGADGRFYQKSGKPHITLGKVGKSKQRREKQHNTEKSLMVWQILWQFRLEAHHRRVWITWLPQTSWSVHRNPGWFFAENLSTKTFFKSNCMLINQNRQNQRDFYRMGARSAMPVMYCKQSLIKKICTKSLGTSIQNQFACKATIVRWFANSTQTDRPTFHKWFSM